MPSNLSPEGKVALPNSILPCIIGKWACCIAKSLSKSGVLSYLMAYWPWIVEAWPPAKMTGELDSLVMPFSGSGRVRMWGRISTQLHRFFDILHYGLWNEAMRWILSQIKSRIRYHLDLNPFAVCYFFDIATTFPSERPPVPSRDHLPQGDW